MIDLLFTNPIYFLITGISLIVALTIHEFAHAIVADKLGDPTARYMGRVTLNPIAHLDPIGTLAILFAGIGWGKPVPFDEYNLNNPKRDTLLIALAGPVSNFILAIIITIVLKLLPGFNFILIPMLSMNVALGVFNLIPVTPLDGSKILMGILPTNASIEFEEFMNRYGLYVLLFLLIPMGGGSIIGKIIYPIINIITNLLLLI